MQSGAGDAEKAPDMTTLCIPGMLSKRGTLEESQSASMKSSPKELLKLL